jgi:hypothetical protein
MHLEAERIAVIKAGKTIHHCLFNPKPGSLTELQSYKGIKCFQRLHLTDSTGYWETQKLVTLIDVLHEVGDEKLVVAVFNEA